jgi:hypothetical protein
MFKIKLQMTFFLKTYRFHKGLSSYLAVLITAILLSLAMGTASIVLGGIKMTRGIGDSVTAFYAADTGIERSLYEGKSVFDQTLDNGATYSAIRTASGADCPANNYCVQSTGYYKNARRAIRVMR